MTIKTPPHIQPAHEHLNTEQCPQHVRQEHGTLVPNKSRLDHELRLRCYQAKQGFTLPSNYIKHLRLSVLDYFKNFSKLL